MVERALYSHISAGLVCMRRMVRVLGERAGVGGRVLCQLVWSLPAVCQDLRGYRRGPERCVRNCFGKRARVCACAVRSQCQRRLQACVCTPCSAQRVYPMFLCCVAWYRVAHINPVRMFLSMCACVYVCVRPRECSVEQPCQAWCS